MSLQMKHDSEIPAETARVAKRAFPKGHAYFTLREKLDTIYTTAMFVGMFSEMGQPAESPWRLVLVSILQYAEGLTDRQAADAVRARIDWKYLLGLRLEDEGFDYSVLSEFRQRIITSQQEEQLLEVVLEKFREMGLLRERGKQRTDSTHIWASVRRLNRLELVGETLRATLNCLAQVAPAWLKERVPREWYERYGSHFSDWRLPKGEAAREQLAVQIGQDGHRLLNWIAEGETPAGIGQQPEVKLMYRVWIQQYYTQGEQVSWRQADNLPPAEQAIVSPFETEARASQKRETVWLGYKMHLTETCDEDPQQLHSIVHVETTAATTQDEQMTDIIHTKLAQKNLLPSEHYLDRGYVTTALLRKSQEPPGIEVVGPIRINTSWQAHTGTGFDVACFAIDWDQHVVTCPQGHTSLPWRTASDRFDRAAIRVRFSIRSCRACPVHTQCTRSLPRSLQFKDQPDFDLLQAARQRELTPEFQRRYAKRAGIEGTLSQATRAFDVRRARYRGLVKTHLQHIFTVIAINLSRFVNWCDGLTPKSKHISPFAALACALL